MHAFRTNIHLYSDIIKGGIVDKIFIMTKRRSILAMLRNEEEVAVGERIAYWIRTPQVPGSGPGWYGTFY